MSKTEQIKDKIKIIEEKASNLWNEYKFSEAEQSYRQVLELKEMLYGDEHPDLIRTIDNVATMLIEQGRPDEAESCYRRSLALREKFYGDTQPYRFEGLYFVGACCHMQGKHSEAEEFYKRSIEAWDGSSTGPGIHLKHVYVDYVELLQTMGRNNEAKSIVEMLKSKYDWAERWPMPLSN